MTEYRLNAAAALGHAEAEASGARLVEDTDMALIAMTTRNGKARAMATAFNKHFGCPPPAATDAVTAGSMTIMASALDQVFVTAAMPPQKLEQTLAAAFGSMRDADRPERWLGAAGADRRARPRYA